MQENDAGPLPFLKSMNDRSPVVNVSSEKPLIALMIPLTMQALVF